MGGAEHNITRMKYDNTEEPTKAVLGGVVVGVGVKALVGKMCGTDEF